MGNIAKTPLTALIFVALVNLTTATLPYSEGYREALSAQGMPLTGYVQLLAVGLLLSLAAALLYNFSRLRPIKTLLMALIAIAGTGFVAPPLARMLFGERTGLMTTADTLLECGGYVLCAAVVLLVCLLAFRPRAVAVAPVRYKLKLTRLLTSAVVLPVLFCVLAFVALYFIPMRSEAFRLYYLGVPDQNGVLQTLINILLANTMLLPATLLQGFLFAACLFPLTLALPGKRLMPAVIAAMLSLIPAVLRLAPVPFIAPEIRVGAVLFLAAHLLVYGVSCAFVLGMCMIPAAQPVEEPAPVAQPVRKVVRRAAAPVQTAARPVAQRPAASAPVLEVAAEEKARE